MSTNGLVAETVKLNAIRQERNRDVLLRAMKPLEKALEDQYKLTFGLGAFVSLYYRRLLRATVDLNDALERLSMEPSAVKARVTKDQRLVAANLKKQGWEPSRDGVESGVKVRRRAG